MTKANRLLINDAMKHLTTNLGFSDELGLTEEGRAIHTHYLNLVGMLAQTNKYTGNPALLARDAERIGQEAQKYAADNIMRFDADPNDPSYNELTRELREDYIIQRFGGEPNPLLHDGRIIIHSETGKRFKSVGGKWINLAEVQRGR